MSSVRKAPTALSTGLALTLFGLMLACWVILLAGTGAAHSACVAANKPANPGKATAQPAAQPQKANNNGNNKPVNNQPDNQPDNQPGNADTNVEDNADAADAAADGAEGQLTQGRKLLAPTTTAGRRLLGRAEDVCYNRLSLPWWVVWFELICIVLAILLACVPALSRFSLTAVAFYAMSTTLMMTNTAVAHDGIFELKDSTNTDLKNYVAGLRCAMAGSICLMIFNFIYVICATDAEGTLTPRVFLPCIKTQHEVAAPGMMASTPYLPEYQKPAAAKPAGDMMGHMAHMSGTASVYGTPVQDARKGLPMPSDSPSDSATSSHLSEPAASSYPSEPRPPPLVVTPGAPRAPGTPLEVVVD